MEHSGEAAVTEAHREALAQFRQADGRYLIDALSGACWRGPDWKSQSPVNGQRNARQGAFCATIGRTAAAPLLKANLTPALDAHA